MRYESKERRLWIWLLYVSGMICIALVILIRLFGDQCLIDAVYDGANTRAKILVLLGANVNARRDDDWHWTVLHCAADTGNVEMIHFLVQHGAEIDAKAVFQVTPRALAQVGHHYEAEQALIGYGAKPVVPKDLHMS